MTLITVEELCEQLPQMLAKMLPGEEIQIIQEGRPVATLASLPYQERGIPLPPRVPGMDAGRFTVPADFNDPMPDDWLDEFYNGEVFPCRP